MTIQKAPLIALLSDFGLADPYVGQMKSVLMSAAPGVPLLDISHDVSPQDLLQGAFFLAATLPWLPPGAVVVAVVDPGVGTDRRVLLVQTGSHWIVAPDNGLLTLVLGRGEGYRVFDASPRVVPVSATFHGRDVFAPLAARLAMGESGTALGTVMDGCDAIRLEGVTLVRQGDAVTGRVLSVDRFGNVILSLDVKRFGRLPAAPAIIDPVQESLVPAVTYADISHGAIGILAGSQGYMELAVPHGSAASRLRLVRGDAVTLHLPRGDEA
jgi:S-adenosyl-L-methionine hydrolase (adenosine-forming)